MDRKYKNNPDRFSYNCSNVDLPNHQVKITDSVKSAYRNYFGVKVIVICSDQDKPLAPHVYCKTYVENLRVWRNGKRKSGRFSIPVALKEEKDHVTD